MICRRAAYAILGLPPRIDHDRLALAHDVVIPPSHRRLDELAHCGHMLKVIIVFRRLVGPRRAEAMAPGCPAAQVWGLAAIRLGAAAKARASPA